MSRINDDRPNEAPSIFISSPISENNPNQNNFFFSSPNMSDPFLVRQNAFQRFRFANFKLFFHWALIIFHFALIIASISVLVITRRDIFDKVRLLQVYLVSMIFTSAMRIFQAVYEKRYPIVTMTEWGSIITRPVTTTAAKVAYFCRNNLNTLCLIPCIFICFALDKDTAKNAALKSPILYSMVMVWIGIYFLYLVLPVFFILSLVACLPCIIIVLQRFFNISLNPSNENNRAAPANRELLEKIWKVKYEADESFKYVNPEAPDQTIILVKEDTKCSICLGWYEQGDELRILPCSHHFHLQCADEWFKITATCPLCVRPLQQPTTSFADNVDSNV